MELLESAEKQGLGAQCGPNSGLKFPGGLITLNFAPVDLREDDGRSGVCWLPAARSIGRIVGYGMPRRAVRSADSGCVLPVTLAARATQRMLIIPVVNAEEACLASALLTIAVQLCVFLIPIYDEPNSPSC